MMTNIYRPVFEQQRNFEHYAVVKRLATAVNPQRGEAFTAFGGTTAKRGFRLTWN